MSPGCTTSITAQQAAQLAVQARVSPTWNAAQAEETFQYSVHRRRHTVWYENATADYERARLAKSAGFAGIDLWYAGAEDPAVWPCCVGCTPAEPRV